MKVKLLMFNLQCGKGIGVSDLFKHLQQKNGHLIDDRMTGVVENGDWWTGVVLAVKDQKAFMEMRAVGQSFKITAVQLAKNSNIVDFNFFLVHKHSGRGLYQHYHQSTSFMTWASELRREHSTVKQKLRDHALSADPNATEAKVSKQYSGFLTCSIVVKTENLQARLAEWARVTSVEFVHTTLDFEKSELQPLAPFAKTRSNRIVFRKNDIEGLAQSVASFLSLGDFRRWRVEGVDPDGHKKICTLLNDYDSFAEFEHSEIAKFVAIDSSDMVGSIQNSDLMTKMLSLANGKLSKLLTAPAP